jgi:primosomal protein N' (replication factor Y) (superfamily II helicase)
MFVIEVIPLIRGTKIDTLSYYSATSYPVGTFLNIPVRGKTYNAVVVKETAVSENKSSLKSASFTLRKLPEQASLTTVPENILKTAAELAKNYPTTAGAILFQLLPPDVRSGEYQFPVVSSYTHNEDVTPQILTGTVSERFIAYRSHIRSVLARRGSVLFVVPTSVDIKHAQINLTQGIEDRVVIFSPTQSKKERANAYKNFEDTSLAKLIITTQSHAYIDRVDLLSIIIEESGSDFYTTANRPYLDHRVGLLTYAKTTGRSILFGDIVPRTEEEHKRRQDFYNTYDDTKKRIAFSAPLTIIEQKDRSSPDIPFSLFSKELQARTNSIIDAKGRVFMFGARRGLAPVVTCIDCGHIFRCPDSDTPYSLIKTMSKTGTEERWFVSGTSGKKIRAADTCPSCGSWRLRTRGIGIQHVHDEALTYFPKAKIFLFDHTTATTRKRAEKIIADFYATRGSILIGTKMALPYLKLAGVDLSVVVSLDATRANPTWRADEDTFRLLLTLRDFSTHEVMVQTRLKPDAVLDYAACGILELFYDEEISLREMLNYPPFVTFVLLSYTGDKATVEAIEAEIKLSTKDFAADFYTNPSSSSGKILRHALFRITGSKDKANCLDIVRKLPPYIRIEIDPNRIV